MIAYTYMALHISIVQSLSFWSIDIKRSNAFENVSIFYIKYSSIVNFAIGVNIMMDYNTSVIIIIIIGHGVGMHLGVITFFFQYFYDLNHYHDIASVERNNRIDQKDSGCTI